MRIARRPLIFLILVLAPWVRGAHAQDSLGPPPLPSYLGGSLNNVPDSAIGGLTILDAPVASSTSNGAKEPMNGAKEPIGLGEVIESKNGAPNMWLMERANVWSSGTWLDRGFWYSEQDAVVMVREFDKKSLLLARDLDTERTLQVRTRHPGAVANVRITVGRFLFRDEKNWDHNAEVTFFGAGEEFQSGQVTSLNSNRLVVPSGEVVSVGPLIITQNVDLNNISFDASNRQNFTYAHKINSLEFNYHLKQRMQRDQMTLKPNGDWIREATPTQTMDFLAGLRWFSLDEWLIWNAEADPGGNAGDMRITAKNDLVGFQLGAAMGQKWARFSVNFTGKAGIYINFSDMKRDFKVLGQVDPTTQIPLSNSSVHAEEEALAFIGSFQGLVKYHLHPNFSLRLAYELLYVNSAAVAPDQVSFTPAFDQVVLTAPNLYHGVAFGIEGYW